MALVVSMFILGVHDQVLAMKLNLSHALNSQAVDRAHSNQAQVRDAQSLPPKMFMTSGGVGLKLTPDLGLMYMPRLNRPGFSQSTEGVYLVSEPGRPGQTGVRWFFGIQSSQLQDNRGPGRSASTLSAGLLFSLSR